MALPSELSKELSNKDIKILFIAIAPLLLIIILTIVLGKGVFAKLQEQRASFTAAKKTENILSSKRELLTRYSANSQDLVNPVTIAVPGINSSPVVLSQLKLIASERLLSIQNIKVSPPVVSNKGFTEVQILFDIDAEFGLIISLLEELEQSSPITKLKQVRISPGSGEIIRASIFITHYYSDFPDKLPPIDQPLVDFTSNELQILTQLSLNREPLFFDIEPVLEPAFRQNPFE